MVVVGNGAKPGPTTTRAVGLGLIESVDGKFEPKAVVTRGEAAGTLVKLLNSN